ncbi:MAG: iron-containing alcohol dehydrogenase [Oscillospiraceae bacterium]|nr:iron-containing alcohol dehydrogenase [Oscillospiraceae bacterium]
MAEFNYCAPTEILFGSGMEQRTGELVRKYGGTRVLLVYGGRSAITSGVLPKVEDSLRSVGLYVAKLGGVVANPHLTKAYEGIEICKKENIDFVVGAGGASVIDTAKTIAYGAGEPDKDVWELFLHDRKAKNALPVGAVPTIAAAGSEMSDSTVLTDDRDNSKRSYHDHFGRPKFAIIDAEFTLTLPEYQTMCGCADVFMHTMERYLTNGEHMEITDSIAEALMRTVIKYSKVLKKDPSNLKAREEIFWASDLSHNDLTGLGNTNRGFVTHKLGHELSGMFDITHGASLTALWGTWARYVYENCPEVFAKLAVNVHGLKPGFTVEETALKGIEATEDFFKEIGMPTTIRELGIDPTDEQLQEMADRCAEAQGGFAGTIRRLYKEDMLNIFRSAL